MGGLNLMQLDMYWLSIILMTCGLLLDLIGILVTLVPIVVQREKKIFRLAKELIDIGHKSIAGSSDEQIRRSEFYSRELNARRLSTFGLVILALGLILQAIGTVMNGFYGR